MIKLSSLKPNDKNPRLIKDDKFKKLCLSLKDFPQMMELRPIVVDENNIILGGNMRYKALKENGMKEIPDEWVKKASDLTDDQKKEFIVKDNVGFGEWEWDTLANEWDTEKLIEWGLDKTENRLGKIYGNIEEQFKDETLPYPVTIILTESEYKTWDKIKQKIKYKSDNEAFFNILKRIEND